MQPRTDLFTLGRMSERLQRAPGQLENVIRALAIEPQLRMNGVPYYATEDETRIDQHLREAEADAILQGAGRRRGDGN